MDDEFGWVDDNFRLVLTESTEWMVSVVVCRSLRLYGKGMEDY
jgi:hypothetical protein